MKNKQKRVASCHQTFINVHDIFSSDCDLTNPTVYKRWLDLVTA